MRELPVQDSRRNPDPGRIRFRPLRMDDLELMHRWLNAPHVAKWWGAGPTIEAVTVSGVIMPAPLAVVGRV